MGEDKSGDDSIVITFIAISLGVIGNCLHGVGLVIEKVGHTKSINENQQRHEHNQKGKAYVKNRTWQLGLFCFLCGSGMAAIALSLRAQSLILPLKSCTLVTNVILANRVLGETIRKKDVIGTTIICVGILMVIIFGPKNSGDIDERGGRESDENDSSNNNHDSSEEEPLVDNLMESYVSEQLFFVIGLFFVGLSVCSLMIIRYIRIHYIGSHWHDGRMETKGEITEYGERDHYDADKEKEHPSVHHSEVVLDEYDYHLPPILDLTESEGSSNNAHRNGGEPPPPLPPPPPLTAGTTSNAVISSESPLSSPSKSNQPNPIQKHNTMELKNQQINLDQIDDPIQRSIFRLLMYSYICVTSVLSAFHHLLLKSFGEIIVYSTQGSSEFNHCVNHPFTYGILFLGVATALLTEYYRQIALRTFGAIFVVPILSVQLLIFGTVLGAVYFDELDDFDLWRTMIFVLSIFILVVGILVITWIPDSSKHPMSPVDIPSHMNVAKITQGNNDGSVNNRELSEGAVTTSVSSSSPIHSHNPTECILPRKTRIEETAERSSALAASASSGSGSASSLLRDIELDVILKTVVDYAIRPQNFSIPDCEQYMCNARFNEDEDDSSMLHLGDVSCPMLDLDQPDSLEPLSERAEETGSSGHLNSLSIDSE